MYSIRRSTLSRFATDKILNNLQLIFTTGLKSAGVVEDITIVVSEDEFVFDVMHATLQAGSSRSAVANKNERQAVQPLS
jgi:hypothetical protein